MQFLLFKKAHDVKGVFCIVLWLWITAEYTTVTGYSQNNKTARE